MASQTISISFDEQLAQKMERRLKKLADINRSQYICSLVRADLASQPKHASLLRKQALKGPAS